jgi:hypothetical protein
LTAAPPLTVRCVGGSLVTEAGPISLIAGRRAAERLRRRLDELIRAIDAAERWRRAAGWDDPEAADWPAASVIMAPPQEWPTS